MRFWRSIGLLVLALGILAVPAHAAKEPAKPAKAGTGSTPQRRAWMFGITPGYGGTRFVGTWRTIVGEFRSDSPAEYPTLVTGHPDWIGTGIESGSRRTSTESGASCRSPTMPSITRRQRYRR